MTDAPVTIERLDELIAHQRSVFTRTAKHERIRLDTIAALRDYRRLRELTDGRVANGILIRNPDCKLQP